MTIEELILQATLKAREDFLAYTIIQEKAIYDLLGNTAEAIIRDIERFTVAGKIPPTRLTALYNRVTEEMRILRPRLSGTIKTGMQNSIDYGIKAGMKGIEDVVSARYKVGIGSSWIDKAGKIHKWNAMEELYNESMWAQINYDAMAALFKYRPAGITFAESVWQISWEAEKKIRYAIEMTALQGKSAAELSRTIRGFLNEPEKLFRRVRVDGKLVLSEPAKAYTPGRGVYRSAYKNSLRLSTTEMARGFSEGSIRYAKSKDWIKKVTWNTGSGQPCPECSDLSGQTFLIDEAPSMPAHPFCACFWTLVVED